MKVIHQETIEKYNGRKIIAKEYGPEINYMTRYYIYDKKGHKITDTISYEDAHRYLINPELVEKDWEDSLKYLLNRTKV